MQNAPDHSEPNPFRAPHVKRQTSAGNGSKPRYPGFVLAYLIVDLVFSAVGGAFAASGYFLILNTDMADRVIGQPMILEIFTAVGITLCGLCGDAAMLARKRVGAILGYLKIFLTIVSLAARLWILFLLTDLFQAAGRTIIGLWIGGGIVLLVRSVLLVLYLVAVVQFLQWYKQTRAWRELDEGTST